jgi:parallel beta-helix repeat protein
MRTSRSLSRFVALSLVAAGVVLVGASPAQAATLVVPTAFPTIQDAVDAAVAGDVIKIKPGTYDENVDILTSDLTIMGTDKGVVVDGFDPGAAMEPVFHATATNVQFENLAVRNGEEDNIRCEGDACGFKNVRFGRSINGDCLRVNGNGALVRSSRFRACGSNAIEIDGNTGKITDNDIALVDSACVDLQGDGTVVKRNVIRNCEDSFGIQFEGDGTSVIENDIQATDNQGIDGFGTDTVVQSNIIKNVEENGIELDGNQNTIKNNSVTSSTSFSDCYDLDGDDMIVVDNKARACSDGGFEIAGKNLTLKRNRVASAGNNDCFAVSGDNALVQSNVGDLCEGGVQVFGENPRVISNTVLNGGDDDGFQVFCADSDAIDVATACDTGEVRGNFASGNNNDDEGFQISVASGTGSFVVTGNTALENNDEGFEISMDDGEVTNNVARRNGSEDHEGIGLLGSDNLVEGNTSTDNGGGGLTLSGDGNTVQRNVVEDNAIDGIRVSSGTGNTIHNNESRRNDADGIENDGTDTVMTNNLSKGNKVDCTNDGTFALGSPSGNTCGDGSDFTVPGTGIDGS